MKELTQEQERRCQAMRDTFHTMTAEECDLVAAALSTYSMSASEPALTVRSGRLLLKCMKREAALAAEQGAEVTEATQKLTRSTEGLISLFAKIAGVNEPEG